jgi:hypothetical protein
MHRRNCRYTRAFIHVVRRKNRPSAIPLVRIVPYTVQVMFLVNRAYIDLQAYPHNFHFQLAGSDCKEVR